MFEEQCRPTWIPSVETTVRLIGLIRSLCPVEGPCQPQLQRAVVWIGGERVLKQRNASCEVSCIDTGATELCDSPRHRLLEHRGIKGLLLVAFARSCRWPQAQFAFDLPRSTLHGGRLLPGGHRPPQQLAALIVMKAVEKQEPGGVFGNAIGIRIVAERLAKVVAGLVEPQLLLGLKALFERGGQCRHRDHQRHQAAPPRRNP